MSAIENRLNRYAWFRFIDLWHTAHHADRALFARERENLIFESLNANETQKWFWLIVTLIRYVLLGMHTAQEMDHQFYMDEMVAFIVFTLPRKMLFFIIIMFTSARTSAMHTQRTRETHHYSIGCNVGVRAFVYLFFSLLLFSILRTIYSVVVLLLIQPRCKRASQFR